MLVASQSDGWARARIWDSVVKIPGPYDTQPALPVIGILAALWLPADSVTLDGCVKDDCRLPPPKAYECKLSWCKKTYDLTKVSNGQLSDVPTSEEILHFPLKGLLSGPSGVGTDELGDCFTRMEEDGLHPAGYYPDIGSRLLLPGYIESELPPKDAWCPDWPRQQNSTSAYWINAQSNQILQGQLSSVFTQQLDNDRQSSLGEYFRIENTRFPEE